MTGHKKGVHPEASMLPITVGGGETYSNITLSLQSFLESSLCPLPEGSSMIGVNVVWDEELPVLDHWVHNNQLTPRIWKREKTGCKFSCDAPPGPPSESQSFMEASRCDAYTSVRGAGLTKGHPGSLSSYHYNQLRVPSGYWCAMFGHQ